MLETTLLFLRSYRGRRGRHEGVALWGGDEVPGLTRVTSVIAPRALTGPGFFRIPPEESLRIGAAWQDARVTYVGQVHSHPPLCGTRHSLGDDEDAYLKFEGLISIVVGDYARRDDTLIPIENAGVHLFSHGEFRTLSRVQVRAMFRVAEHGCVRAIDLRR